MGIVILGLAAPMVYAIISTSSPLYSDSMSQAILSGYLPIFFFLFIFAILFIYGYESNGGQPQ